MKFEFAPIWERGKFLGVRAYRLGDVEVYGLSAKAVAFLAWPSQELYMYGVEYPSRHAEQQAGLQHPALCAQMIEVARAEIARSTAMTAQLAESQRRILEGDGE